MKMPLPIVLIISLFTIQSCEKDLVAPSPPDTYRILFQLSGSFKGEPVSDLFTVSEFGGDLERITDADISSRNMRWSEDGAFIYHYEFDSVRGGIYRRNNDGTNPVNLTQRLFGIDLDPIHFSVSRDGKKIAFLNVPDLFVFHADSIEQVTDGETGVSRPIWSPVDDNLLAFTAVNSLGVTALLMVDLTNGITKELTPEQMNLSGYFVWSPDGSCISFTDKNHKHIYILDIATLSIREFTSSEVTDWKPNWSPDGRKIVFVRYFDVDHIELIVKGVDDDVERILLSTDVILEEPGWAPHGESIAFRWGEFPRSLYLINQDGSSVRKITSQDASDREFNYVWSPVPIP